MPELSNGADRIYGEAAFEVLAKAQELERQGKEILTTGKVNVFRDDAEELLAVKRGKFTYEEIVEYLYKINEPGTI